MQTYLSAYALDRYRDCPRKFALSVLQDVYWPAPDPRGGKEKAELGTRFHQWVHWHSLGLTPPVPPELAGMVGHFLASEWATSTQVLSEWDFFVTVAGLPLRGRFDRLQRGGRQWWIVDWKTGSWHDEAKRRGELETRWQHRLYPLALVKAAEKLVGMALSPEDVQMVYYYPEMGKALWFPYDSRQMEATVEELTRLAPRLAGPLAGFARNREHCRSCTYRSACYPDKRPEEQARRPVPRFT